MNAYRSAPVATDKMPGGIPYIVSNEAAERFSFYGMKGILVVFMTKYLVDSSGVNDTMSREEAMVWYHSFTSAVYFFPVLGALISDWFLGKYRTILWLSIVYCAGHAALAVDETRLGLWWGLTLIAIGSGGIKPCVSAHVGDQFGKSNAHLLEKVFGWFYFSINLGAFASTLLTPWLLKNYGPHLAFGIPGVLMAVATVVFWMGRHKFIHIPPGGMSFVRQVFSKEGIFSLGKLFVIYAFVAMFWALFDQTGSAWVLQAEQMDRRFLGFEWLSSQIQAVNPIMIMVFIPIFGFWIYPAIDRVFKLTPIRKIGIGLFLTVPAFLIPAWIETRIAAGEVVNIGWQLFAYVIITAAEVFVSITCLEFSYTQAPKKMKSVIMACFLMSVSLGNVFVGAVNHFIQNPQPGFTPTKPGRYVVELRVADAKAPVYTQQIIQAVKPLTASQKKAKAEREAKARKKAAKEAKAKPPALELGHARAVEPGGQVNVFAQVDDGDAKGGRRYAWELILKPEGSQASLSHSDRRYVELVTDRPGAYRLSMTFTVGEGAEAKEVNATLDVVATTEDLKPIAVAGTGVATLDKFFKLDASASYDLAGDELSYQWKLIEQPRGSDVRLVGDDQPTQTAKISGTEYYLFFALMMFLTALLFVPYAYVYKPRTYIQDEEDRAAA